MPTRPAHRPSNYVYQVKEPCSSLDSNPVPEEQCAEQQTIMAGGKPRLKLYKYCTVQYSNENYRVTERALASQTQINRTFTM